MKVWFCLCAIFAAWTLYEMNAVQELENFCDVWYSFTDTLIQKWFFLENL